MNAANPLKRDSILPDPCVVALGDCLRVYSNGHIEALNSDGELLIDVLSLDESPMRERRRIIIGTIRSLAVHDKHPFTQWMGFPDDLPNFATPPNRKASAPADGSRFRAR